MSTTPSVVTIPKSIPNYTTLRKCRVCGSSRNYLLPLFTLGEQAVSDFVPREGIHQGILCPIELELCELCGLVQSRHTARQDFLYTRHYWYRSGTTATMKAELQDVVESALSRLPFLRKISSGSPYQHIVLDIGSNDGTLLRYYPPHLIRIGVEPANNLATTENYHDEGLDLIHDFWPPTTASLPIYKAHVVTACGMFYDLEDPNQFIAAVKQVLHPDGVFIAQLMCLKQTLQMYDVGNLAHEHLEFYSLKSLNYLFHQHGLQIFDIEENTVNGGSYRLYIRHTDLYKPITPQVDSYFNIEHHMDLSNRDTYYKWFGEVYDRREKVVEYIKGQLLHGKTVHIYGASTKGNVILQFMGLDHNLIPYASDRSLEKHGLYTIGTGIPIISEEESRAMKPDNYLILPYAFSQEFIQREMEFLKRGGVFIIPIPNPRIVYMDSSEIKEVAL